MRGRKLLEVSTCRDAYAGNEKFAGDRENPAGMARAKEPLAGMSGVWLTEKPGTRGIVKARMIPILLVKKIDQQRKASQGRSTHTTASPNRKKTKTFLVNHRPHRPRSPRFHSFHF